MTEKELETINIGMFGHIDHGKTTLLQKLSGKWTDTHSEEIKRGITIKLGYADTTIYKDKDFYNIEKKGIPVRNVSFIDCPGHEMLMTTTLSGAALIDAAILVIAANEGIKPQTREHLMTLQAKKITNLIIVQNKIDLVEKEVAKKNYEEIKNFLGKEYENSKIIPVSAQQNVNIDLILKEITEIQIPDRKAKETPIFIVARSFDINRPGTIPKNLKGSVLGGSLKQGTLKENEEIEIRKITQKENIKIKTKIVSMYKGSEKLKEMFPGGSTSIETELDMSLGKADALSGSLVSHIEKLPEPQSKITLKFTLFPKVFGISDHVEVEKLKQGELLMLSINTSITGGAVSLIKEDSVHIDLKVPAFLFKNDNVAIARNINNHWRLIGYGEIC
ncbi:MAG: translation initiation factor IF-2 subunit gamma [Nanoarchaeota archaeon]